MKKKISILFVLLMMVVSCQKNPTELESLKYELAVSCVIRSDSLRQKVLFTYVKTPQDEYRQYPAFVDSAEVFINGIRLEPYNPEYYRLSYNSSYMYNYFTDSLRFRGGDTLQFFAKKNSTVINGETVVPGEFTITTSGKTISWTKSAGAYKYLVEIRMQRGGEYFDWQATTERLSVTVDDSRFISGNYEITVTAYDKNYYDYHENITNRSGIESAYGIFSAVYRVQVLADLQ